jgi:hypothetical protein
MANLRTFIINEDMKASHAVKFLSFQDNFHDDVLEDIVAALSKDWKKLVETKSNSIQAHAEKVDDLVFKNPDAFTGIEFDNKEIQIGAGRFSKTKTAIISVKISYAFTAIQRKALIKDFLYTAKSTFEKILHKNIDAFNVKLVSGSFHNLFNIKVGDDDTVKIQFKTKDKGTNEEIVKTIFMVGVEHGKEASKIKHFDRIFFIDYTK